MSQQLLNEIRSHPGFPGIFKDLLSEHEARLRALEAELAKLKEDFKDLLSEHEARLRALEAELAKLKEDSSSKGK